MTSVDACFKGQQGDFTLDVAFRLPDVGVSALFGPSGCGKTTILRCIAGLTQIPDGHLLVNNTLWQDGSRQRPPHKRPVGYVFQDANLFAHLSVKDNLIFGQKRSKTTQNALAFNEVVDLLGLSHLLSRSPKRLSGGERQRVAIGRALLSGPEILLMDEPLAALDKFSKNEIIPYLENLHQALAIPIIYVSHDITEVERLADYMVLMEKGRVRASGPLSELLTDPTLPFAREPEATSIFTGHVATYDAKYGLAHLAVGSTEIIVPTPACQTGSALRLRIFARDVGLCRTIPKEGMSIINSLPARIERIEPMGDFKVSIFLRLGQDGDGASLMAHITKKSFDALGLKLHEPVVALIKSVALIEHV